jgi:2-keto-3-deoxy-L-rhamnonate aldolase RhmA
MRANRTLDKLRRDEVALGPVMTLGSPDLVELTAQAGFDFLFLDWQHGEWTEATLNSALARFLAAASDPIVRVKGLEPGTINRVLDMGASGAIVPMVETPEQAAVAAAAVRYPPRGQRSGGGNRLGLLDEAGAWGYFERANDAVLLVVMVESQAAVERAGEIAAVPGVDVVLVGPGDLLLEVRSRGGSEADVERLVARLPEAVRGAGKAAGYVCGTPEAARQRIEQGYRFITYQSDVGAVQAAWRAAREQLQGW